jgi:hypothetical protein
MMREDKTRLDRKTREKIGILLRESYEQLRCEGVPERFENLLNRSGESE